MKKKKDFVMGLSIYMACLREKKRYSTAKSYQNTLNSFKCYGGDSYAYIKRNRLLCYQSWLLDKGRSLNTVSTYMRRIRHIYNLAVGAEQEAPFACPTCSKMSSRALKASGRRRCARDAGRMFNARWDPSLRRVQLTVRLMFAFSGWRLWISRI